MEEKFMYGTISVSVSLPKRINAVRGAAGTGKTFLAKTLVQLTFKGYEVIPVNYGNYKVISYENIVPCAKDLVGELIFLAVFCVGTYSHFVL